MCKNCSLVLRYGDTLESARGIVEYILSPEREVTLDIQDGIVNEHCKIGGYLRRD